MPTHAEVQNVSVFAPLLDACITTMPPYMTCWFVCKHALPSLHRAKLRERLSSHLASEFEKSSTFTDATGTAPLEEWAFQGKWAGLRQATAVRITSWSPCHAGL